MSTRTSSRNRSSNFFPMQQQFKEIQSSTFDKNKQFVSNCYTLQHCDSCTNVFIVKTNFFFLKNKKLWKNYNDTCYIVNRRLYLCLLKTFSAFHSFSFFSFYKRWRHWAGVWSGQRWDFFPTKICHQRGKQGWGLLLHPQCSNPSDPQLSFCGEAIWNASCTIQYYTQNVIKIWCASISR